MRTFCAGRSRDRGHAQPELRARGGGVRARPAWVPGGLLDLLPLARDATVLDLGAGTGKLTRVLAGRYARTIAVEPLDGMRAILEREAPAAEALPGAAEAVPLPDAAVDAV